MPFDHETLKHMVSDSIDQTSAARLASEKCRDYYDGRGQWTEEERTILRNRKQPITTHNILRRKVDAMVGLEQRGRTDPVAYPREPGDEESADVATKALRFVEETQRVDVKASEASYNLFIEGYGGVEVIADPVDPARPDLGYDVTVNRIRWEEILFDSYSREKDFSDAGFTGINKWMTSSKALAFLKPFWEGKEEDLAAMLDSTNTDNGDTFGDRPNTNMLSWYDKKLKRVRVVQIYYLCDGVWYMSILTGRGEICNIVSPWLDHKKKPHNPMVLMSAYVDRENNRYGFLVEDLLSLQDEVNKRRSKMLHQLNSRQTWGVKGAVASVKAMKSELAKPDGHVEVDPGFAENGVMPFNIIQNTDQLMGQAQLLADAVNAIDNIGPNAALMGQMGGQASGRAMMAAQQAGMAELAPIYDSKRDWTERVYRTIWSRIKQVWTGPKWIRVTGENEAPQFIGINQPVPMMDQMGMPVVDPMTMQPAMQMQNAVAEMDVDIIIEQAPDYATLQAEQFEKLAEMMQSGVPIPPMVLIEASSLSNKRKLLEMMQSQSAPPPDPMVQRAQAAEIAVKETKAKDNDASAQKKLAEIEQIAVEVEDAQLATAQKHVMAKNGIFTQ
jgi:hypothetical protein